MKFNLFNTGFPRINTAFTLLVVIALGNAAFNYYIIRKNKAAMAEMTRVMHPYSEALAELNLIVTESKMYATNWVYLQNSVEDKKKLKDLHQHHYREIKQRLESLARQLGKKDDVANLARVFARFNELINVETRIMSNLTTFDDYENPQKKFASEEIIESEVLPRTQEIIDLLGDIIRRNEAEAAQLTARFEKDSARMMTAMLIASLGLLACMLIAVFFISGGIFRPVLQMKKIVHRLSRGELIRQKLEAKNNVVGEMVSAVNALSDSFNQTSRFANEIGKGNLNVPYEKLSDEDVLGDALINMRNSLRAYSEDMEEKVRERTEELTEKSAKLAFAYGEIRDSINYAKRIQESILPSSDMIGEAFSGSFIFYKPKDVVCGDFYWFGKKDNEIIIAAVDCTGHGVPGALMTVIGNSLLNQINAAGITRPAEILYQLDKKLYDTLRQHGGDVTSDGMDLAVCRYLVGSKTISYAGARRPFYLMRDGKLQDIKGSRAPIGRYLQDVEKHFEEHEINLEKGDILYLFSDGLQDQFGGPEGKKYMISRLRETLHGIQALSMAQQKAVIEKEMAGWQKDFEQTDDMLLIGIRI